MRKPDLLREKIAEVVKDFATDPDKLQMFIDNGEIVATGAESLSFEYRYHLTIVALEFPYHPDLLVLPVLDFLRKEQSEVLFNPERRGFKFEVDFNDNETADLMLVLPLTERVIVQENEGDYQLTHGKEPVMSEWQPLEKITIFLKGKQIYPKVE